MIPRMRKLEPPRRASIPSGLTLVEIMVVVALSSLLMGVAISLGIALKQADRGMRQADLRSDRWGALAETLRADIRQAVDVSRASAKSLVVSMPDGRDVRYEVGQDGCERIVMSPGEPRAGKDLFEVGPADAWELEAGTTGRHRLLIVTMERLALSQRQKPTTRRSVPLVVYAALGADLPPNTTAAPNEPTASESSP